MNMEAYLKFVQTAKFVEQTNEALIKKKPRADLDWEDTKLKTEEAREESDIMKAKRKAFLNSGLSKKEYDKYDNERSDI